MPQAGAGSTVSAVRPRLGALDMAVHLWRAKWLMAGVFVPLAALGVAGALSLPTTYEAPSRLIVSRAAGAGEAGLAAAVHSEIELMRSPRVAEAALARVTLARAYPSLSRQCTPDMCTRLGIAAISEAFEVDAAPGSPVISAAISHARAAMSAEMTNALVEAYIVYRAEIYSDAVSGDAAEQRKQLEKDVSQAEAAIREYLRTNNLTELASGRETLRFLHQTASAELLQTQARVRQADAQLADYREQIESIPPEAELFAEDSSGGELLALKLEREDKLLRYKPESRVIQDLDARIERAEELLYGPAGGRGVVRVGTNPLYLQVESAIATLQSEVQALRSREAELKLQIAGFEERQLRLFELEPELQALERRRDAAASALSAFVAQEARGRQQAGDVAGEAAVVRVLEPATAPVRGESFRLPALIAAVLIAAFAALIAGMMRALTRRGLATPGSAERTLGLPALASVQKY